MIESLRGDQYLRQESQGRIRKFKGIILEKLTTEPTTQEKIDGLIVYADGSTWNPGSGAGFYRWDGSSWNYLG